MDIEEKGKKFQPWEHHVKHEGFMEQHANLEVKCEEEYFCAGVRDSAKAFDF